MVRDLFGAPPDAGGGNLRQPQPPSLAHAASSSAAVADKVMTDVNMTDTSAGGGGDGEQTDMGVTHFQCVAARAACRQIEATSIAPDATFGKTLKLDPDQIGDLNVVGDKGMSKTFRGARVKRGGETVNQSVTMTIDPTNLNCIVCEVEHLVVQSQTKPVVVVLSDQNFVPTWPNTNPESCVVVIRMSNPDLHELFDFLFEIFERAMLPDGSMVLAGSVSYLHRVGTSYYAREWTQVVSKMGRRLPNVRVCPLPPLITVNCSGGVARELVEIGTWIANVYKSSPQGLLEVWNNIASRTIERSAGQTTLNSVESYTISLPASLEQGAPDKPTSFYTNCSRPSILYGLDQGTTAELLRTVSTVLDRDFKIPVGTGLKSASARTADSVQEHIKRVVLVGASNLKKAVAALEAEGLEVIDLCTPGWVVNPANVEKLVSVLKSSNHCHNSAFVFDLFGNSSFRAALFDGSTIMPVKLGGGWWLPLTWIR